MALRDQSRDGVAIQRAGAASMAWRRRGGPGGPRDHVRLFHPDDDRANGCIGFRRIGCDSATVESAELRPSPAGVRSLACSPPGAYVGSTLVGSHPIGGDLKLCLKFGSSPSTPA